MVEMIGFEPMPSCSQGKRVNQATLHLDGGLYGTRTRVVSVTGRCANLYTNKPNNGTPRKI